ncbi:MAG: trypsin-like peptidase domain-containing protein [Betaproteobacteria bacterium]
MAGQAVRAALNAVLGAAWLCAAAPAAAAEPGDGDVTFLAGDALGKTLLHNLVRIQSEDIGEQGIDVVVGATDAALYVLTVRHVVARAPAAGLAGAERVSAKVTVRLCDDDAAAPLAAEVVDEFDQPRRELALLKIAKPASFAYVPLRRALAPKDRVRSGDATWVLGFEQNCALYPVPGRLQSLADAQRSVRALQSGIRGGSSGGALLTDAGIVGLVTSSDQIVVRAIDIAGVGAQMPAGWGLVVADNIAPQDPRAAERDLAETANRFLFAMRNMRALLLQPAVPAPMFADAMTQYNAALRRYRDARDKYDGALATHWPADVLASWVALRDAFWQAHLVFWQTNDEAQAIYRTHHVTDATAARLRALDPALDALERDVKSFLAALGTRENHHAQEPAAEAVHAAARPSCDSDEAPAR